MPLQPDDIKVQKAQDSFHTHSPSTYTHNTLTTQGEKVRGQWDLLFGWEIYMFITLAETLKREMTLRLRKNLKLKVYGLIFFFLSDNKQGHFSWLKGPERVWEEWFKFGMLTEVNGRGNWPEIVKRIIDLNCRASWDWKPYICSGINSHSCVTFHHWSCQPSHRSRRNCLYWFKVGGLYS